MQEKTRAQSELRRVSQSVFRQVDTHGNTPAQALRQGFIASRFGLMPATAALVAELAYPIADSWRGRV